MELKFTKRVFKAVAPVAIVLTMGDGAFAATPEPVSDWFVTQNRIVNLRDGFQSIGAIT